MAVKFLSDEEINNIAIKKLENSLGEGIHPWTAPQAIHHFLFRYFDQYQVNKTSVSSQFKKDSLCLQFHDGIYLYKFVMEATGMIIFAKNELGKEENMFNIGFSLNDGYEKVSEAIFHLAFKFTTSEYERILFLINEKQSAS